MLSDVSCLVLFDQARCEAAALDREFAETKKLMGPLHGVPVTFKDKCERRCPWSWATVD